MEKTTTILKQYWPPHPIPAPRVWILADHNSPVNVQERLDVATLCARGEIPYRVTGGNPLSVVVFTPKEARERGHFRHCEDGRPVALVDGTDLPVAEPERSIRLLEILAHGFHDYAARECARGLFGGKR